MRETGDAEARDGPGRVWEIGVEGFSEREMEWSGANEKVSQRAREQESKRASARKYAFEAVGRKKSVRAKEGDQD